MIEDTIRLLRRSPFTSRLAKFVPGFSAIAPLMAGLLKLAWWKFVALDAIGAVLWAASYVGLGWVFRGQLEILAAFLERFATWMGIALTIALTLYGLSKYFQRQQPLPPLNSENVIG